MVNDFSKELHIGVIIPHRVLVGIALRANIMSRCDENNHKRFSRYLLRFSVAKRESSTSKASTWILAPIFAAHAGVRLRGPRASHNRGDGDFGWLSSSSQSVVFCLEIGIEAGATSAGIESARRTMARPPPMKARPAHRPDCLSLGARLASFPTAFSLSSPSYGISMKRVKAVIFERAGTETRLEAFVVCNLVGNGLLDLGELRFDLLQAGSISDRVPPRSLIAVVKLIAVGIAGQAHGSLRGRHFGRLIMALDRLSRPMWCSRLSGRTSTRIPGIGLNCAIVLTGRSRWSRLTRDNGVDHASSLGSSDDQRKGSPEIHIA